MATDPRPRCDLGRLLPHPDPLARFLEQCVFDPTTGCVLWIGSTSMGRGHSAPYGTFKFEGRRWYAHRWSAAHIQELDIDGLHVDHCCDPWRAPTPEPLPPNTLCVRHVQPLANGANVSLMHERKRWLMVQKGYEEAPPLFAELHAPGLALPMHEPPEWWPVDGAVKTGLECPF